MIIKFFLQKFGGISKYFYNLALNIYKENKDLEIFSPVFKNFYAKDLLKHNIIRGKYFNEYPKFTNKIFNKLNFFLTNNYLEKKKPNIFHLTYYNAPYKKNQKIKYVLTVYDLIHEKYSHYFDKNFHSKKHSLEIADHIICISENTKQDLIEFYNVDKNKISTIYLGVNQEEKIIKKIKFNKRFILYVGDRNKYKNFKNFIIAYSKSTDLQKEFDIICFGGKNFNKFEINLFTKLKLNLNSIRYISGDDELLKTYYSSAEFLIIPSLYEGFGLPLIEAMSLNCPVLCSHNSSLKEIGADAAIYFDPENYEDIKVSMENFVNQKFNRNDLIKKGKLNSQKFSWKTCANETLSIYKQLI